MKKYSLLICLLLSKIVSASVSEKILGTWEMTSFVRITDSGKEIPWCLSPNGFLIYSKDGFMSAAINCDIHTPKDAPSQKYGNKLFYTGAFEFTDAMTVAHGVKNSSQLDLMGKSLVRKIESINDNTLVLTGEAANGTGRFRIEWKKVNI